MGYRKEDHGQGSIPEFGAIFMSNSATRKECFERQLLGLPYGKGSFVKQIKFGMALFLFEFEKRELHGVFRASSDGAMNIVPNAFSSSGMQFPAQVRFTRTWHCSPLREHEFRGVIKENYFAKYKFNFGLSVDQVRSLLELFKLRRLESKLPCQPVIREDRDRLIGENKRVPSTNLGTTDDSRLLKIDARENRCGYDAAMEHSRTSFHNRKRYHDDIEHDHGNKRVPSTNLGTTDDSRLLKIDARENKCEYDAAKEHSRISFHNRKRYHDDIEHDHDMNHGVGRSVIHDTGNMNRPGREGDASQYAFALEYPEDSVSEVRRAGQDGSYLTRNVIEEDKHYVASGCGFAARSGFENTGDEDRRTTNDGCRYTNTIDHRTESNHNLDDVPEPYYPADYHGSLLLGDNGMRYPVKPLEKLRKIHHDDRFLFSDRVETAGDQFVGQPDVEWSASGRGKSWGNVYSEKDPRVERGFEDETSTLYDGFTLEEARNLRTEGILPGFVGYKNNSPRSNLPVVDNPRENPPFCSSNTISQTDFSFGSYQSKPYPGLPFSHSTSYDTLATKLGPYEPKILDIHHRRSPHADNLLLQPVQKFSPHHSFIGSPHLTKMTKKTSPCHLEAEETGRHLHLGDARGSYGHESQDVYSKHSSYGNNSLVQNYPPPCENYLNSLGRRASPSLIQDEDASQHHQVTGGPYDPEILGGCGNYSSYVGGNSIHQQQQQQMQDFFPLHVSSIASNIVSSKERLPGDTFHQFQSCHKPGDYNSSGRTSNLLFGTECYYANMDPKSSSFGQFGDLLSSGPPVSMPSTTSAGVNDYKNIHHEEGSQMSGFKEAASAAKCHSYLHRNLSSEPPRKHNGKYNQSFKESSCAPRRRTEIDQTSSRTSVFDRLTSGSKPRATDADSSDADASVDEIMDALYQNLNHPVPKKAKVSSVVGQQKKELPWVAKHVKMHSEVLSDMPEMTATEMKNESKQVTVDGDLDSDDQIRKDTRVVEFNRRKKKKIEESHNPKSCVENAEIGASSFVQQVQQENESSGGKVVVNRRRKLLRPTFGKKEQSNDEMTNNGDSNLQLTSPPNNLGKICNNGDSNPSSSSLDQSIPPTSKSNAPPNEAAEGDLVRETISEPLGSVSERKESVAAEDAATNGDQHYRKNGQIRRPKFTTVKEHNNTGSSEKDGFQSTILQYSSSRVEDTDSYINEENNRSSEKDGFPQSVAGEETSYKNADCLDCRNSSNLVDDKAPAMITTEN